MNKILVQLLIICCLVIAIKADITYTIDTREVKAITKQNRDKKFAKLLKQTIEHSPQPSGYCYSKTPTFPLNNQSLCGAKRNIGWIFTFTFNDPQNAHYEMEFGVDFGLGSAIFIDGKYYSAEQKDLWWAGNWKSSAVFRLSQDFEAGEHTIVVYGAEKCCDGQMNVRFARDNSGLQQFNLDKLKEVIPPTAEEDSSSHCEESEKEPASEKTVVPEETSETQPEAPSSEVPTEKSSAEVPSEETEESSEETTEESSEDSSEDEGDGLSCKYSYTCDEYNQLVNANCGGLGKTNNEYIECAVDILEQQIIDCTAEDRKPSEP